MTVYLFLTWASGLIDGNFLQSPPLKPFSFSAISSDYEQSTRNGLGQPLPGKQLRPEALQDSQGKLSSQCLVNHSAKAYSAFDFLRCLLQCSGRFDERKRLTPILWLHFYSAPTHLSYSQNEFFMVWGLLDGWFVCLLVVVCFFGVLPWVQSIYLKWQPPFYITNCNCHRPLKTSLLAIIFSYFIKPFRLNFSQWLGCDRFCNITLNSGTI